MDHGTGRKAGRETGALAPKTADVETVRLAARALAPERYLAALLAPKALRPRLVALAAFAGETARIPVATTEPVLGEIRLQWWREALEALVAGRLTGNPAADALAPLLAGDIALRPLLERLLEARALELYDDPLPDTAALEAYLDGTEGALAEVALRVVGEIGKDGHDLARVAGRAVGLTSLLERTPRDLARRRLMLPADRLLAIGFEPEEPTAPPSIAALRDVSRTIVGRARTELAVVHGHELWQKRAVRAGLGTLATVSPRLAAIERSGHDPLSPRPEPTPLARVWYVWRAVRLGRL